MTTFTPRYALPRIESSDNIKESSSTSKLAADINRVSDRTEIALAGVDEKAMSSVSNSLNAKQAADAAAARNLLQDILLEQNDLRLRALEAIGSLVPGSVTDGTIAATVNNDASLTHEALESAFVKRGTIVHDVRDYGAKGDNTTDDSAAFTAAIAAAKATRGRAYAYGTFRLDQPIVVDSSADFGDAIVNYYGEGIALDIVGPRVTVTTPRELWNRNKENGTGWAGVAGSTGVRTINTNGCTITVPFVSNFETGLHNYGSNGGCAYNTFYLGWLFNNKVNHSLSTYSSTSVGYTNQNTYIGGRMSHHAAEGNNIPGVISVMVGGDGDGGPNNNIWINPCWEGVGAEYSWYFHRGRDNKIYNVRNEYGNAGRFGSGAVRNEFHIGYESVGFEVIHDEGSHSNDILRPNAQDWYNKNVRHWDAGKAFPWLSWEWGSQRLRLGAGTSEGTSIRGRFGYLEVDGSIRPETTGNRDLGSSSFLWRNINGSGALTIPQWDIPVSSGAAPPAAPDLVRTFSRKNASGKTELCARHPSGAVQVISTEP